MHRSPVLPLSLVLLVPLLGGCDRSSRSNSSADGPARQTAESDAQAAVQWFDLLYASIRTEALSPPRASRVIGYAGVALYESVVPGMEGHRSLSGQLNGLSGLPQAPAEVVHWPSAANAALARVLGELLASASAATLDAIADLEASLADGFVGQATPAVLERSIAYGDAVGMAVAGWAAGDGYSTWQGCAFDPPTGEGMWEPTPPGFAPALEPCWGRMRTFALLYSAQCLPVPHPAYSTDTGSAFYAEAFEVYDTVNNLTQEQLDIAQFWADNPGQTGTPPGHWISILGQVLSDHQLDLGIAAEGYARVGIAVADAFIACWDMKYVYNLLRPITYIQDPSGPFADAGWTTAPGVGTPPFPEFTSGHSVQSGAASLVLEDMLGPVPFMDDTHASLGYAPRSFASFSEAAEEAAISRLYGGIHYRAAIDRGVEQGRCIGAAILDRVQFRE